MGKQDLETLLERGLTEDHLPEGAGDQGEESDALFRFVRVVMHRNACEYPGA